MIPLIVGVIVVGLVVGTVVGTAHAASKAETGKKVNPKLRVNNFACTRNCIILTQRRVELIFFVLHQGFWTAND